MQRFSHLYQNDAKLHHFLESQSLYKTGSLLVRVISSNNDKEGACHIAQQIKNYFPESTIVGSSSSEAVLFNGEQLSGAVIIIFELYELTEIMYRVFSAIDKTPEQLADEIYGYYDKEIAGSASPINILFTDYPGVYRFINKFNKNTPIIRLAGGCVGNHLNLENGGGFIFDESGILHESVLTYAIVGNNSYHYINVSTSQEAITPNYNITKAANGIIDEIEGVPALRWIYNFLSLSKSEVNDYSNWQEIASSDYLVHFPLILDNDGSGRFTRVDEQTGKLALYFTELFDNTNFRVGYVNPAKIIKDTHNICSEILDIPTEGLFCYICYFRKLFLENCAKWEVAPFKKHNICGMFMMGEIGYSNGKNALFNGANIFMSIAENEKYILPDYIALEGANKLKGDETFLKKAYDKQRETIISNSLVNTLKYKEEINTNNLHIDKNLNIPNIYQFEKDNIERKYAKICFVESQTADATIAFVGQEKYFDSVRDFISMFNTALTEHASQINFYIYALNYKTLVIASDTDIDDQLFIDFVKNLYNYFGYATSEKTAITAVNRVVILLNQQNPIEQGMNLLISVKDSQETFIICDSEYYNVDDTESVDDLKGIELLKRTIDKDLIVPYYQGIYDNRKKCIDKYEALIRIIDVDGTIYSPVAFLDTSKKYKFYNSISKRMIEKVLAYFEDKEESVSINISKYDIVSSSFRIWLLKTIKQFPDPQRIVIEFLETEDVTRIDVLYTFVEQLKKLGTKIAIDDFGSGYSTFTTIVALKPDFIKIDGSIIKDLIKNDEHQVILDSISYLANRLGAATVAEFVENEEIQSFLEKSGIDFSQGYHFSKPSPQIIS